MAHNTDLFDDYAHLLELVGFAVRKEVEAADFYRSMATKIESPEVKDELGKLAAMEEGHRDRLERLNVAESATTSIPGLGQMKSADYETPGVPTAELGLRQLLEIAIGREIAAWKLYSDLANLVPESMMKQLLLNLAAEESKHRQYLERLVRSQE